MKRIFALALFMLILFAFTACGENKKTQTDAETSVGDEQTTAGIQETELPDTTAKTPEKKIFKVGLIVPENAQGAAVKNGVMLAVQQINSEGEIQLEVNFSSEGNNGETASQAYDSLKAWGMQVIVGTLSENGAAAVSQKSTADSIFYMSLCDKEPTVHRDNIISMCSSDYDKGKSAAVYIYEKMPDSKVAVIYRSDDEKSKEIYDSFKNECESAGVEIVNTGTFTKDTAWDFSEFLSQSQNEQAQVVLLVTDEVNAALIMEQSEAMGFNPVFMGFEGIEEVFSVEGFKKDFAKKLTVITPFNIGRADSRAFHFTENYTQSYEASPDKYAAYGFDAISMVAEALKTQKIKATSETEKICRKLISAFTQAEFDGITGTCMNADETGTFKKIPEAVVIIDGVFAQ